MAINGASKIKKFLSIIAQIKLMIEKIQNKKHKTIKISISILSPQMFKEILSIFIFIFIFFINYNLTNY